MIKYKFLLFNINFYLSAIHKYYSNKIKNKIPIKIIPAQYF